jgi:HEAT repeat protein
MKRKMRRRYPPRKKTPGKERLDREYLEVQRKAAEDEVRKITLKYEYGVMNEISIERLCAIGKPAVPLLIEYLDKEKKGMRWTAVFALGELKDKDATEPLIRRFGIETDTEIRTAILYSLGGIGDPRASRLMVAAMDDPDHGTMLASTRALGEAGDAIAVPILARALGGEDTAIAEAALNSLEEMAKRGIDISPAIEALRKALFIKEQKIRKPAISALSTAAKTGVDIDSAIDDIGDLIHSMILDPLEEAKEMLDLAFWATSYAAANGSDRAIEKLEQQLGSEESIFRKWAARGLIIVIRNNPGTVKKIAEVIMRFANSAWMMEEAHTNSREFIQMTRYLGKMVDELKEQAR